MAIRDNQAHWHPEASGTVLRDITVGHALREMARQFPDRPALVFCDGDTASEWSYADLDRAVDRVCLALSAWGVGRGDHVAVMATNGPEWIFLEYGLARIGARLVTINTALKRDEIAYILRQAKASTLFYMEEQRGYAVGTVIASLRSDLPALARLCVLDRVDPPGAGSLLWAEFLSLADGADTVTLTDLERAVSPDDIAQIQYTSGTTGLPKGAMLRHRSIVNNAALMGSRAGFSASDRLLSAMPLFHTAGCVCNVLGMLMAGGCLILLPSFDAATMARVCALQNATVINAVPTMYLRMIEEIDRLGAQAPDLAAFRIALTGGTSIPPELMRKLKMRFDAEPMIIMGMTEASPIVTQTSANDSFEAKITTAGTPLPHTEVRIADPETGATLECDAVGELQIRGYQITAGYYEMPEETAQAITAEGWLRSGDLARLDADGHLTIVGRIKDMIIRGGENIFPVEIENFLISHPDIGDAYVVGVPDPELGEEIFAFVRQRAGAGLTQEVLQAHCRAHLSRQKMPRYVNFVEALPMTANGKVQKFTLREIAASIVSAGRSQS